MKNHIVGWFVVIVLLTGALVISNTHRIVVDFLRDKNAARLVVYIGAVLLLGLLILNTSHRVFAQVIDASSDEALEEVMKQ